MKRWIKWALTALVVLALAAAIARALSARKDQQQMLAAGSMLKTQSVVELAATDVTTAKTREISQGLPVSGTLKAVNSAIIKARVSGELQGLSVREGDFVTAGQVIARIDASEYRSRVEQAQQQAGAAKAQTEVLQRQYDNNQALVDQGFISRTALDTSLANLHAAQATHRAALAGAEVARKSLDDTVLKAPISGQVSQRLAQPGERVGVDTRIVEIIDLRQLELEAALSAGDALSLKVGQIAELQVEGSARPVTARLVRVNPSAQVASRSVLVYLSIDNAADQSFTLRQGLFAQGTLGTARVSMLAVPVSAVRNDKVAPYVQLVENAQVIHKPVELGVRGQAGEEVMVAVKGLAENDSVILGAVGILREGTRVRVTQTPAVPAGAAPAASSVQKPAP